MNKRELIELLEGVDDLTEIRFAHQPSWPFEYAIADIHVHEVAEEDCDEEGAVVYLVEGNQVGYLPGVVRDAIGWGR